MSKSVSELSGVRDLLRRIGDKWAVLIVIALEERGRRFSDIKRQIDGISQRALTKTLRSLERDGIVKRTVYSTTPPQVEYALTSLGISLSEPIRQLVGWSVARVTEIDENTRKYDSAI